jgi:poly(3-hydroxybutyrate) depolymerase
MGIRILAKWLAISFLTFTVAFAGLCHAQTVVTLPKYNVSVDDVSISGFSSGADMAVQMHFAYSKTIRKGAGVIAGAPMYCAQGSVMISLGPCMLDTAQRHLPDLLSTIATWSASGYIDPTSNMQGSRVYLFSGKSDMAVHTAVMDDLQTMYTNFLPAANIRYVKDEPVPHTFPTDFSGKPCGQLDIHFVNNCHFDAAGEILQWLYGPLKTKVTGQRSGIIIHFDQAMFWGNFDPIPHGMDPTGELYVPADCAAMKPCRLHVALHGCMQNLPVVSDEFYDGAGYNRWADTNRIIVLYPRAQVSLGNLYGCWDWWGHEDVNYAGKGGGQMVALKTMIDRIVSGNTQAPFTCREWFDSNVAHVRDGRAYVGKDGQVYAQDSNQYLGFNVPLAYTAVRETAPGYYAYGSCP